LVSDRLEMLGHGCAGNSNLPGSLGMGFMIIKRQLEIYCFDPAQ